MNPRWKAGVASVVITPTEPMWLAGWAARRLPASGAATELYAKALALEDASGERVVIVTADLIAIPRQVAANVPAAMASRWNLPRERFLFNASHTHTGPEVRPDRVPFFEIPAEFAARIEPYVAILEQRLMLVIETALERLQPVTLHAHQAITGFARNRRSAGGSVDHDVPVLSAKDATGKCIAVLFGYACHNLTLPPSFREFHGDYAGVAKQALEQDLPGAQALFLAGAGADQDPEPRGTLELTVRHGQALAMTVKQGLESEGKSVFQPLRVAFEEVVLDLQALPSQKTLQTDLRSEDLPRRRKAAYLLSALAENRPLPKTLRCPVQVLRFGNELLVIALGGEPVADYAARFKSEFAGPLVWVAGYSNDMFGYLPTQQVQQEGGYEAGRATLWSSLPAPLAESAEERIVEAVRRLVHRVSSG